VPTATSFCTWREAHVTVSSIVSSRRLEAIAALVDAEMLEGLYSRSEFHYLHHVRWAPSIPSELLIAGSC